MADHPSAGNFNRWAIVIGISRYQDESLNLGFADRDALAFYDLIRSPSGGDFKEDHVALLVNEDATTRKVTQALRSFLKRPAREDLVLIYIACHGSPDPERPSNVYLLTHDVDKSDIPGTGVPMDEIDASLQKILHAEKVVIIADTCHSAAIGGGPGLREVNFTAETVNNYLDAVSQAKGGTALITSCEANETAQESESWGGGHGVFTHYLLEGMRGGADRQPRNGQVTLGELFEYVREKVKDATSHRQHPSIGTTQFDRELPMAVPGMERARELIEEAQSHFDAGRFDEAERLWTEAADVSPSNPSPVQGLEKIKAIREREAADLNRRRVVLREYFQASQLSATQFNEAMQLLDKSDGLSDEETNHRSLLMALVDRKIDVSVYVNSIDLPAAPANVPEPEAPKRERKEKVPPVDLKEPAQSKIDAPTAPPPSREEPRSSGKPVVWISAAVLVIAAILVWQFWPAPETRIRSFSANATSVSAGETVTLTWATDGAGVVSLEPLGSVSTSGSATDTPAQNTEYLLIASGPGGEVRRSVRVEVVSPPPQSGDGDTALERVTVAGGPVVTEIEPGLGIRILAEGSGAAAQAGETAKVHYTGWLYDPAAPDGRGQKFDSSIDRDAAFSFEVMGGQVIPGWEKGIVGMKVGERRELILAPEMAYGDRGAGGNIPGGATLVFEVELLELRGDSGSVVEGESLIVRTAPVYPARALSRSLEGHVDVSFTVTTAGTVKDAVVVSSSSNLFERAALTAVLKYKYKPRKVDGVPVEVPNVTTRVTFEIED